MVVISVYTYGVKIIKKFRWESGFLWGGSMEPPPPPPPPPLCTNGSAGYLMQLSVKGNSFSKPRKLCLVGKPNSQKFQWSKVNHLKYQA